MKNNYLFLVLFGISLLPAMERTGTVTRSHSLRQRTSRNKILSEMGVPVNEWNEESKQQYFTNHWHRLLQLKSNYLKNAELSGHRCVTSWIVSTLCAVGAYHMPVTMCQACAGAGAAVGCLYGASECISACDECKNNAATRNRIEYISEQMGWQWQEYQ